MKRTLTIVFLLVLVITACAPEPTPIPPTNTPTLDYAATEAFEATEAQMQVEAQQTEEMAYQFASETAVMEMTETESSYATATREMAKTNNAATSEFRRTEAASLKQTETAVYDAVVNDYLLMLEGLVSDGYLTSTAGSYYELEDANWEWAQMDYYDFNPTGYSPTNFVLTSHVVVSTDSDTANWWNSGCGFLFRVDYDSGNHYRVFWTMDGYVDFSRVVNGAGSPRQPGYFGTVNTPTDSFDVMLVVEGNTMRAFVNGNLVKTFSDTRIPKGVLMYSLVSGTNKGYGTRCEFSDVVLFELEP